jgi:hypothetical protein
MVSDLLHNPVFLHRQRKHSIDFVRRETLRPWPPIYQQRTYNNSDNSELQQFMLHRQFNTSGYLTKVDKDLVRDQTTQLRKYSSNSLINNNNITKNFANLIDKNNCLFFNNGHINEEDFDFHPTFNSRTTYVKNKRNIKMR